jgi:hypothetical protein
MTFRGAREAADEAWSKRDPGDPPPNNRRFKPIRFRDIGLIAERPYLVKGVLPREGLVVIWGPPKCGKSFWTFDMVLHVALGWEYRDRRVQSGTAVYIACEGERGIGARTEAFRIQKVDKLERDVRPAVLHVGHSPRLGGRCRGGDLRCPRRDRRRFLLGHRHRHAESIYRGLGKPR